MSIFLAKAPKIFWMSCFEGTLYTSGFDSYAVVFHSRGANYYPKRSVFGFHA